MFGENVRVGGFKTKPCAVSPEGAELRSPVPLAAVTAVTTLCQILVPCGRGLVLSSL